MSIISKKKKTHLIYSNGFKISCFYSIHL